jgi:hypothetical protein
VSQELAFQNFGPWDTSVLFRLNTLNPCETLSRPDARFDACQLKRSGFGAKVRPAAYIGCHRTEFRRVAIDARPQDANIGLNALKTRSMNFTQEVIDNDNF